MEMTECEVLKMYRQAGDKGKQIQILAELNQTSRMEIIRLLLRGGEQVRIHLPCRGKKRKQELTEKEYREIAAVVRMGR